MTTLREAAQQALEALETCDAAHPSDGGRQWYDERLVEPAIEALRAALAEPDTCTWQQDGDYDSGMYGTSCRRYFNLEGGTPEDSNMQWCCYCGKKLMQELITEDEDD